MVSDADLRRLARKAVLETDFHELGRLRRGKVRDSYVQGDRRYIVVTDRISAFDVVLGAVPLKGQVLNQLAAWWLRETEDIVPNHLLDVPDPAVSVVVECRPLPLEMVVRAYLTGSSPTSIWRAYERGDRVFCGHELPDGMRKHEKLERPLVTPSTKAGPGEHDRSISRQEAIEMGLVSARQFDEMADYALALFERGSRKAAERGLILVDTKYEFGLDPDGRIRLIDEVHTPDSSRYWYAEAYEEAMARGEDPRPLDKEFVRRYLKEELGFEGTGPAPELPEDVVVEAARRYLDLYEQVVGEPLEPDLEDPIPRMRRNLGLPD